MMFTVKHNKSGGRHWKTRHRVCASSCMISKHWKDLVDEWNSIADW